MQKEKRTRSWFLAIFGLPFFAVGVYFLFTTLLSFYDVMRMASWPQVQGTLITASLHSSTSDNTTTYSATAQYRYRVGGMDYSGDRVAIHGGGDNIGDFQHKLGSQLELMYLNRQPVAVYYNPSDPNDAILNRDLRWAMIGFKAIFIVAFGGAGLAMILFGLRGKRTIVTAEASAKPWLARPEWAENRIRSGARTGMYAIWFFAVIWNAISAPGVFAIPEVWRNEGALALVILLFPLVGMGLLFWAIRMTREWRRYGATPLTLDPFPGAIGGDVGGEIEINIPYVADLRSEVTLSCLYSYESGSGEDRSRHERVEWQDSGYAQVERTAKGMKLRFRFTLPEGLHSSEEESGDYYFWRLAVRAELPGTNLDRSFTIPVYATGEKSRYQHLDSGRDVPHGVPELEAEALLPLRRNGMLQELYYPMFRQPGFSLGFSVIGTIFAITGIVLWGKAAAEGGGLYFMGGIFTFIGSLTALIGFYMALNTLYVAWDGKRVVTIRRLLGVTLRWRSAHYHEISEVLLQKGATSNQKGSSHQINYHVLAKTPQGEIVLAENIDSHSKAKLVVEFFRKQYRLKDVPEFVLE